MNLFWTIFYVLLAIVLVAVVAVVLAPAGGFAFVPRLFYVLVVIGTMLLVIAIMHWVGLF